MIRFRMMRLLLGAVGLVGVCALAPAGAHADIITHFNNATGSAGNYTWNYSASVAQAQTVTKGDYFELIDFNGYNGTHSEPAGWTLTTSLSGPIPPHVTPTDDPAAQNLIWTYNGDTPITGQQALGTFTAGSTLGTGSAGTIVAQGTLTSGLSQNMKVSNIGGEMMPNGAGFPLATPAPEPTTLAVLVLALPVVVHLTQAARRRRTARAA
jgi:hypothetical protein